MGILVYGVMIAMLVFIFMKNFTLLKRYKHNKNYIACYKAVLDEDDNAYESLNNFIENDKSEEYRNKAKILKIYYEVKNNIDYSESLNSLDLKKIYYNNKNKIDNTLLTLNSDSSIFLIMAMSKAYACGKLDVVEEIYNKVKELDGMEKQLEYQEILSFHDALLNCGDGNGIPFMNCLLNGNYSEYKYDKNLIGIYKRIAAAVLAFKLQPISDYDEDLKTFAGSLIGKQILNDLRIYDKYTLSEIERSEE